MGGKDFEPDEFHADSIPQTTVFPSHKLKDMTFQREDIQAAIRRVQSGELSPADATKLLMGDRVADRSIDEGELLSELIARLGEPPTDVLGRWSQTVHRCTLSALAADLDPPPVRPDQWWVGRDGNLFPMDQEFASAGPASAVSAVPRAEHGVIAERTASEFRRQFGDAAVTESATLAVKAVVQQRLDAAASDRMSDRSPQESSPTKRRSLGSWMVAILLAASLAAISAILYLASNDGDARIAESNATESTQVDDARGGDVIASPATRPVNDDLAAEPLQSEIGQLETFDSPSMDSETDIDITADLLSLDMASPGMPMLSAQADASPDEVGSIDATDPNAARRQDQVAASEASMLSTESGDDPLAESDDAKLPDESPQRTRRARATAIELPQVDDDQSEVMLGSDLTMRTRLRFPVDVGIDLRQDDSSVQGPWQFVERKQGNAVASIRIANDADTESRVLFRWTELAKRSSVAGQLCYGLLDDASGRQVFLRPKIVSDAYAISFEESDARPSWDLLSPLPPRVSRVSVDFDLPAATNSKDGIELGWIEPVESTSPRRTRGLAVLTPTDGETVAVGIRFDLRCSRKLSARVRAFGRLDSGTPWQLISHQVLRNAADEVTERAARLSQWSTQMASLYSRAGTDERRALRPRRDAIEQESSRMAEISNRLAELESLCRKIEAEVRVRIRVWVQWPDTEQELLVVGADEAAS